MVVEAGGLGTIDVVRLAPPGSGDEQGMGTGKPSQYNPQTGDVTA